VLHSTKTATDGATANLPGVALIGVLRGSGTTIDTSGFDPDALVSWLTDNVFTDANYLGDGIYRVPAELACTHETTDATGAVTKTVDADCVTRINALQPRVRTDHGDGLGMWVQVDANHDEPLGLVLRHDEITLTIDLDGASRAMIAVAQALGEQAPNAQLAGQITIDLRALGDAHVQAALSFDRAITFALADQGAALDGPTATRFESAAAHVTTIELDGTAATAHAAVGLGETSLHLPGSDTDPAATDVFLGGATLDASYAGNTLTLANVSLGTKPTLLAKDGVLGQSIALAPFGATITSDAETGIDTAAITPKLDLATTYDHAVLGDTPPLFDITHLVFEGTLRGSDAAPMQITAGTLTVTTNPSQYGFTATAGQCVLNSALVPCS
jgi:hypothetical protein